MWICLNDGFVSVVVHRDDSRKRLVRARRREHLEALLPEREAEISHDTNADYPWRLIVPADIIVRAVGRRLLAIDYDNFKNSVADDKLHDAYHRVWNTMHDVQEGPSKYRPNGATFPCIPGLEPQPDAEMYRDCQACGEIIPADKPGDLCEMCDADVMAKVDGL